LSIHIKISPLYSIPSKKTGNILEDAQISQSDINRKKKQEESIGIQPPASGHLITLHAIYEVHRQAALKAKSQLELVTCEI
jgi:hypothetical protein